jgi:hypothetical protein
MSFASKSDIKYHPSARLRENAHFGASVSHPDTSGYAMPRFSITEAAAIQASQSEFAADFFAEHSSSVEVDMPAESLTGQLNGSSRPQAPTAARSAQA